MKFGLKKPCKKCPFLKDTEMVLRPGRMTGIANSIKHDTTVFPCHETTGGGSHDDETGIYVPDGKEHACMGALSYALKHHGNIPVLARIAIRAQETSIHGIASHFDVIEDPEKWKTD